MPTGFPEIPTGTKLPLKLQRVAPKLRDDLKAAYHRKTVTPKKPITARRICHSYIERYNITLIDSEIRAMVDYLRVEEAAPITSSVSGYAWSEEPDDFYPTLQHIGQREGRMRVVRIALEETVKRLRKIKAEKKQHQMELDGV